MIGPFSGKYEFLSNFYLFPIICWGKSYASTEHAYQAAKCKNPKDREKIRMAKTPALAKKLGRDTEYRSDWEGVKIQVMYDVLCRKFTDPDLQQKLLDTGNETLVEINWWHDNFWGSCTCKECGNQGENWLGKTLMRIRAEIRTMVDGYAELETK